MGCKSGNARLAAPHLRKSHRLASAPRLGHMDVQRRRGRVAEGGGLLNRYTLSRRIEGSNPSVSANHRKSEVPWRINRLPPEIGEPLGGVRARQRPIVDTSVGSIICTATPRGSLNSWMRCCRSRFSAAARRVRRAGRRRPRPPSSLRRARGAAARHRHCRASQRD